MVNPEQLRRHLNLCVSRSREHALEGDIHLDPAGRWLLVDARLPLSLCPDAAYGGSAVLSREGRTLWQLRGPHQRVPMNMRHAFLPAASLHVGHTRHLITQQQQREALTRVAQWLERQASTEPDDTPALAELN